MLELIVHNRMQGLADLCCGICTRDPSWGCGDELQRIMSDICVSLGRSRLASACQALSHS
jgi:hypothetical protein